MPGRSFMHEFEDPFFADHRDQISRMHDTFGDPFRSFRGAGMLEDGRRNRGSEQTGGSRELAPFDADFGFGSFGKVFENMHRNMEKMMQDAQNGFYHAQHDVGNGQMYQQSSVMSYSNTGNGPPKVFQASRSTRTGPGGVRETRKALRDSERELEKMAIGHHIHDRGHEVERHKNTRTGQTDEFNNYSNMDESEAESFDREWQEKTRQAFRGLDYGDRRRGRRDDHRALPESRQQALPAPRSEHRPGHRSEHRSDHRSEHWGRTPDDRRRDRS